MKIEPWPGGRWFRDLGETGGHKYGHLWGHVQVIKAPTLLELVGPMMMSYAAVNHVQYRLKAEGDGTRLSFAHGAGAHSAGTPRRLSQRLGKRHEPDQGSRRAEGREGLSRPDHESGEKRSTGYPFIAHQVTMNQ